MRSILAPLLFLTFSAAPLCADISYSVSQTVGLGGVAGFIKTDGTTGVLSQGDILSWNLTVNDGFDTTDLVGPIAGSTVSLAGHDLSATVTQLLFNFSGTDSGYVFFSNANGNICFEVTGNCTGEPMGESLYAAPFRGYAFTSLSGTQVIGTASVTTPEPSFYGVMAVCMAGLLLATRRLRLMR